MLEAIKAVLTSGHDATLLRHGADKGEVVLVLDDGTELSKTVTAANSTTAVRKDGKKIPRPAEAIKALTDALSVNPVEFLLAKPKERARVLLEAMPLEADTEHLSQITGLPVRAAPGLHALHVIEQVRQQVFDARTGTNRAVKEKAATINQLEAAVPPSPSGVDGSEEELEAAVNAAIAAQNTTLTRIDAKLKSLRQEAADQIEAIRAEAQQRIDAVKAGLAEQESKAAQAREKANATCADTAGPLRQQLAIIRRDREAAGRRKQTLETIEVLRTELGSLQTEAQQQTAALDGIDAYKAELLAGLPIPGLEVIDGEIYRNGVLFDRLNTAQQVEVAVEVAKLRAADLGIVCVDKIEHLDSKTLDAFKASALESQLQFFVTRVADGEFNIETDSQIQ